VWPGYRKMGFTQNFVVKTSWKITTWKTKDEMGWQYLRWFFGAKLTQKTKKKRNNINIKASSYDFVSPKQLLP
jgi:hypothetical protein